MCEVTIILETYKLDDLKKIVVLSISIYVWFFLYEPAKIIIFFLIENMCCI